MTPTENIEQTDSQEKALTKVDLEMKKLRLEIQDMERPFWKRPTYMLAALPTLLIIITLSVGFLNGFLQSHVTKLISENKELQTKRDELLTQYNTAEIKLDKIKQDLGRMTSYEAMKAHRCEDELEKLKASRQ
jgi:hypothetical protein